MEGGRREFRQMKERRQACERSHRREQRQTALKVLTAPPAICVSVCVSPLPKPQTAFLSVPVHGWRHAAADRRTWHRSLFREATGMRWPGAGAGRGRGGRQSDARTTNQPCALFALTQASELIAATSRKGGALLSRGQGSCQVIRSLGWRPMRVVPSGEGPLSTSTGRRCTSEAGDTVRISGVVVPGEMGVLLIHAHLF